MIRELIGLLFLAVILVAGEIRASDALEGEIRFQPQREEATWVGQELELYLDLWSNGFSFGDQLFVLPEVKGGYLMQADSNTVKLSEKRGGEQWQGLRYTFLLYPQREGRLEVPEFDVSFKVSAGFGMDPSAFAFRTQRLFIDAQLPPGADRGGLVVSSASFDMEASWTPRRGDDGPVRLKVGDALTLEVKRRAQDVPGMVFAPLPEFNIAGLGVYHDSPSVNDRVNRGTLTGTRTDTVTFICERKGDFEIPGTRFQWWDPAREVLSEKVIPALQLEVVMNPAYASATAQTPGTGDGLFSRKALVAILVIVFVLLYPGRRLALLLANRWRHWNSQRKSGEPWAFRQVQRACKQGSAAQAYNAITVWLSRYKGGSAGLNLMQLAAAKGDQALFREALALQVCVASGSTGEWTGHSLAGSMATFRKNRVTRVKRMQRLSALNPRPVKEGLR